MRRISKSIKIGIAIIGIVILSQTLVTVPIGGMCEKKTGIGENIETFSEFSWVYSIIDGRMYKRLKNVDTGEWLSDWILCE